MRTQHLELRFAHSFAFSFGVTILLMHMVYGNFFCKIPYLSNKYSYCMMFSRGSVELNWSFYQN